MILLVDDDPVLTQVLGETLKYFGHDVTVACNGKEAIETYNELIDNIKVVILDMLMPGMDGMETYKNLKQINPHIKVLITSGYGMEDKAKEFSRCGCNDFIQKPFDIHDLSRKLTSILERP